MEKYLCSDDKMLRYCAHINIDEKIRDKMEGLLCNILNWQYILDESGKEGIACLLYNNLSQFRDKVPEDIWKLLSEIYYLNAYRNMNMYREARIILSSFNRENLKTIPLKGIFLAENVYKNIALRGMTDIDLLVKKEDLPKIGTVLEGLGYRMPIEKELASRAIKSSYLNSLDYVKTGESNIDLHIHWHIVNISLPTYMYSGAIKIDRFWNCAKPVMIKDAEMLELAPHHLIMCLAEHALKHSFDRLILLADINEVIKKYAEETDWERLIEEATEFGMRRQLFYSLYFTNYFLEGDISDGVLSRLKPGRSGFLERRFFHSVLNNNRAIGMSYFVYLNMVKGVINKLRFIFRTLFPPPCTIALFFNLDRSKVTLKDYIYFVKDRLSQLKTF